MIQINEWMAFTAALILLLVSIGYSLYFKVSKKLFPQANEFNREIKPNEGVTIGSIRGSGIIKKVKIMTNENCIIDITIDGFSHTMLVVDNLNESGLEKITICKNSLTVEEQLDEKYSNNFAIHIQNTGKCSLLTTGIINFEVYKGFITSIKTICSEL